MTKLKQAMLTFAAAFGTRMKARACDLTDHDSNSDRSDT